MGYSMGARIAAHLAVEAPERVRSLIIGGLGHHLIEGEGLPYGIAEALEAPSIADVTEPTQRMFRAFAEQTRSDLKALAACMRGSRFNLSADEFARIAVPSLICVGTADGIAGDPHALARLNARARAVDVPGRDHNLAVGDKAYKQSVLEFLESRP
jgi:pimeloyl-ACP methyl ester carboxylesterase